MYPEVDGVGYQQIVSVDRVELDLTPVPVSEADVMSAVVGFMSSGFDVTVQVPVRARVFVVAPDEYVLVFVVHHISADGSSMGPMTRDLMVAYMARSADAVPSWAPLAVQYADYALWQREVLGSEDDAASLISRQVEFWSRALAGLPDQLVLPWDRPRPAVQAFDGGQVPVVIGADLHRRLVDVAQQNNSTLFMVVHAALAVVLARLSGTEDITVGTPMPVEARERWTIWSGCSSTRWCCGHPLMPAFRLLIFSLVRVRRIWRRLRMRMCRSSVWWRCSIRFGRRRIIRCSRWGCRSRTWRGRLSN